MKKSEIPKKTVFVNDSITVSTGTMTVRQMNFDGSLTVWLESCVLPEYSREIKMDEKEFIRLSKGIFNIKK